MTGTTERSCSWMKQTGSTLLALPETLCVRVRFCGHHLQSPEQYRRLEQFMQEHRLQICGFSREIALIDYGITSDAEKFVTEICIPVRQE